ncbi:unnamed protein product [Dracunculus medinensis]|uniref:Alpha-carbonic anhydrase domain-containing protein n=1 Tax=Dracunculus medinensis TaxID=318479 RepID=A0A0N4US17_DRAME|nr:unnamed protein product [Dracunculus medinensis]
MPLVSISIKIPPYGYDDDDGPNQWEGSCQIGLKQSPVDITSSSTDLDALPLFQFENYGKTGDIILQNTGTTIVASGFDKWSEVPFIQSGGLRSKYILKFFHLHWGQSDIVGSEHSFSSFRYPAELHLVHAKEGHSLDDVTLDSDVMAIIAFFIKLGNDDRSFYQLEPLMKDIIEFGPCTPLPSGSKTSLHNFNLTNFLIGSTETFYQYEGSLSTPPCSEAVVWTLMADPLIITDKQVTF